MTTGYNPNMSSSLDNYMDICVKNALDFIKTHQEMVSYVKNFNEPNGFVWTRNPIIEKITVATEKDGHSGASFSICLRICQQKLISEANANIMPKQ
tara:strand:+ start:493 stop:780 length:288 start_codon:yes stop_codon:yes gene_type:complete